MQALIDARYEAFETYATLSHLEGCPCCTEPEGLRWLIQAPLRELEVKHLDVYVGGALLIVSDASAFKHFLSRLLEIFAGDLEALTMPEVLLSKLALAEWGSWPQLTTLLRAIWIETIRSGDDCDFEVRVDTALCALGQAYDDLTWFLECGSPVGIRMPHAISRSSQSTTKKLPRPAAGSETPSGRNARRKRTG